MDKCPTCGFKYEGPLEFVIDRCSCGHVFRLTDDELRQFLFDHNEGLFTCLTDILVTSQEEYDRTVERIKLFLK